VDAEHLIIQTTDAVHGFGLSFYFPAAVDAEITAADSSAETVLIADAILLSSFYSYPAVVTDLLDSETDADANCIA